MKRTCLAVVFSLALSACQDVDYVDISPKAVVLKQKNNSVWMQAHAMSHTGVHYSRAHVVWSIKDTAVARIDETGKLTPVKSGATEVEARVGDVKAAIPVEVLYAEKMQVDPPTLTLKEGQAAVEIHVKVQDYLGREIRDRSPIFHSMDPEVLSMGQNAAFPVNPGKTQLEVSVDELKQKIDVTVTK